VRKFNAILLLTLICKASFAMSFSYVASTSCCGENDSTEINCEIEESEHQETPSNGCCDDQVCDCLCCAVIFVSEQESPQISESIIFFSDDFIFSQNPTNSIAFGIWHPPKFLL